MSDNDPRPGREAVVVHNHTSFDIKAVGECPACDQYGRDNWLYPSARPADVTTKKSVSQRQAKDDAAAWEKARADWKANPTESRWRVGHHYGIHVYEGDRPVATFHREEDAARAVAAVNVTAPRSPGRDAATNPSDDEKETDHA